MLGDYFVRADYLFYKLYNSPYLIMNKYKILKTILCVAIISCYSSIYAQERPKLVVGIVVDQMRWDYLYRYYDRYSERGFRRLMNEGFNCQNTMINYIPTVTAAGHASIFTGSVPSIHSIVGNDFIVQKNGKSVGATYDENVHAVGTDSLKAGQSSPVNLRTTTIGDELRLATNFRAKVVGVSLKDRGAIFPAGRMANAAFWLDENTGNWISSSWYMDSLPKWVEKYNSSDNVRKYIDKPWTTLYPINTYTQSVSDVRYEWEYLGDKSTIQFPIDFRKLFDSGKHNYGLLKDSPWGNTITADFAKQAIRYYKLGVDDVTDFLTVSFSATDYVGHRYAPNSIKTEDTYLRLDRDIASLLEYLDGKVGKDQYIVFITADHGGAHNVQFLSDNKVEAASWNKYIMCDSLNKYLSKSFGKKDIVLSLDNYQVNFNYPSIRNESKKEEIIKACIDFFENIDAVMYVVENRKASQASIPAPIKERIINGYNPQHSGEIQLILKPHYCAQSAPKGTTHGLWNPYDSHIPLIFFGKGIPSGQTVREVYMTDIAPTVAALLKIQMPSATVGKAIEEVFVFNNK